ncbi:hypothetical protein KPH14_013085 [Odynerus spinipes]|uniref:Uncharacterized protein n=1 Tax=Odynerus spinipes TaxID=1348599 RepID=A0AAD9R7T8_9HYME|nr:hypothetical protein KPH14_013085 [Odynerus spinipes]
MCLFNYFVLLPYLRDTMSSNTGFVNWISSTDDKATEFRVSDELLTFLRSKYVRANGGAENPCPYFLHVFSHTNAGLPLVIVVDAKSGAVVRYAYLHEPIDDSRMQYFARICDTCLSDPKSWRSYFKYTAGVSDRNDSLTLSSMSASNLSPTVRSLRRYTYRVLFETDSTTGKRIIVISFRDKIRRKTWRFSLTGDVSWSSLYSHYPKLTASEEDDPRVNLWRRLPVEILERNRSVVKSTDVFVNPLALSSSKKASNSFDSTSGSNEYGEKDDSKNSVYNPCWSDEFKRSVVKRSPVNLDNFYYYYLRGLQLPSEKDRADASIGRALKALYFDCVYDRDRASVKASTGGISSNVFTGSAIDTDYILYSVVPLLRSCNVDPSQPKRVYDDLLQSCIRERSN